MQKSSQARRRVIASKRRLRELKMIAKGLASTDHPILAHIIPIRRCNLSCEYCNEYDDFSKPVPLETMKGRIDHLARLNTAAVTLSGGEPLLHPELDDIIPSDHRRVRRAEIARGHPGAGRLASSPRRQLA